jgi:hypothetical protein
MEISTEDLLEVLDDFKKGDDRARHALWITAPIGMLITLICIVAYIYVRFENFGLAEMSVVFSAILFLFGLLIFLIIANDRLKHCINSCLRVKMYILLKRYEQAASVIDKICASELSIKDLKSALPTNPIPASED